MDQMSKIGQIFLWNHEIAIADGDLKTELQKQKANSKAYVNVIMAE